MKLVKYVSKKETNLGRFGIVKKGVSISVTEEEYKGIKNDDRFELVEKELTEEEIVASKVAKPYGTSVFDLRTIPWEKDNLAKILEARMSKSIVLKIIEALKEVGAPVREISRHETRITLADAIIECALLCKWNELTPDERLSLPSSDKVKATPPKPKEEAPKDEDKVETPKENPEQPKKTKVARKRKRSSKKKKA